MGFFYANVALRTTDTQAVVDYLSRVGYWAYVLQPAKGYTVVCEDQCGRQDVHAVEHLASRLSRDFDCPAFAVLNHDDDILMYWLYHQGTLLDTFQSAPTSQDEHFLPQGSPGILAEYFGKVARAGKIAKILAAKYTFAVEMHEALAGVLGLPIPETLVSFTDFHEDIILEPGGTVAVVKRQLLKSVFDSPDIAKPFNLPREIRKLLRQDKKISAIELYRQRTQSTLKEARAYIDSLEKTSPG